MITFDTLRGPVTLSHSLELSSSGHDPLVLIHGLCSNASIFSTLAPSLAAQRRSVLSFDWQGFGRSPLSPETRNEAVRGVAEYSEDLRGFLLANNLGEERPCILVGHAEGAFIAINFAVACPDFVSSLVLISPIGPPSTPATHSVLNLYDTLAAERSPRDLAGALARLTTGSEPDDVRTAVTGMLLEDANSVGLESSEGFRRMCRAMATASEPSYSRIISIRSLIIAGLKDAHAPPAVLHSLAASLHGTILSHAKDDLKVLLHYGKERMEERRWERETRIVTLDAGHWLPLERPEQVALIIEDFLRG